MTAAVLALIFYCLLGWLIILQGARNSIHEDVQTLAHAAWPGEEGSESARKKANELYGGLDNIPENDRANIVYSRIKADIYASAPMSFAVGLGFAAAFSVPVVFGTVIAFILMNRSIPIWLVLLRYIIAWGHRSSSLSFQPPAWSAW